jgi:murein DD-endopeptidase MepM/ murein hydrolase activator NlpD
MEQRPGFTIMLHRDGALDSPQWRIAGWVVRAVAVAAALLLLAGLALLVFYGPVVAAAGRVPFLQRRIAQLEEENRRVTELAQRLEDAEARYDHLRGMLGANVALPEIPVTEVGVRPAGGDRLWVAPPLFARLPGAGDTAGGVAGSPTVPRRWPLTVPSFRTRGLAQGDPSTETHMGLDLAVPVGSDVRAAGGGLVKNTGTDSAYGLFVLLEHADGYETMYGHLSRVLVTRGAPVREGQVIGLSGNSGRSTAPHLHFEVRRGGRYVDPLTLVREGT